ncbi:L-seryl-tRNA(Sec) selenium transferase [Caldisalinibacter kiritimatiensis]|uniref:L-seryl-tRNA(Sec) selenium transferase n=1 Tax=Caldisalinibacter kiritimatiensis TaxID=1304284 RepID=R1CBW0_9FIRM|nr:L-seryl-tRNA(Sec) selenium transferase [Caldisalinibacter kiritimatiensis]EOC99799.1 L-seryl-tRNA(Sec) selenium transferase [Caldisalinibacter kiritimatiensis]
MKDKKELFMKLPKVDHILSNSKFNDLMERVPRDIVVESIREELENLRNLIKNSDIEIDFLDKKIQNITDIIEKRIKEKISLKFKRVINGTGVVIHTNLGRSLISEDVMENIYELVTNYSNLEFDLELGKRGSRYSHVEEILTRITGAESALVVNNNAAAVMLVLSSLAKEKEVVVSRGELVEIGGSFRVPDVMEQSGAKLVDVGTTNKTHISDYEQAISEETAALMKVHTSNYRILGFTESVSLDEIVKLGRNNNIPVIEDLGSGVLIDLSKYGLEYEPTVQDSIKAGADIVTFSGDKLLGGPQAGIIVGNKKYIDIMKKNPLTRAVRVDKFTLSSLEATLRLYLDEEEAMEKIPTLKMITMPIHEIERKAVKLSNTLKERVEENLQVEVVDVFSQVGGGSMPLEELPSKGVVIYSKMLKASSIERKLREQDIPIVARVYKEKLYLDLRTVKDDEIEIICKTFKRIIDNT